MKKIFRIFVLLFLVAAFVGCGQTTTTETPTTNAPTTLAPTTAAPTTQAPTTVDNDPVFVGVEDVSFEEGTDYDFLTGITVTDDIDQNLLDEVVVDSTGYDNLTPGEYTINLSVEDSGGNVVTASYKITITEHVLTDEEEALLDIEAISLDIDDLVLPRLGENGTAFYWSTNNERVITETGFVMKPHVGGEPVSVKLTVEARNGEYSTTADFNLVVQPNQESTVTSSRTLDFEGTSEEYVVTNQTGLDVYYVDNGTVPYMDIETFLNMVDGALESSIIEYSNPEEDVLRVDYEVEYLDLDGVTTITEQYYAIIDFTDNTFTVNNFDFFAGYIASTESDYGEGLNYVDADYVDGQEVVIPLGEYNFDLIIHEEGENTYYLMPLSVINRLFMSDIYYDVYYNGDKLWGLDTFVVSSGDDPALITQIKTSTYNLEVMAFDMKLATYNFLALTMDYFYGLKEDKGFDTYYDVLYEYAEELITGSDRNLYNTIQDLAYGLDDLHSWHQFSGYYEKPAYSPPTIYIEDLGASSRRFYTYIDQIEAQLLSKYGIEDYPESYSIIDAEETVAVIHLTGFTIDTPDEFKLILDSLPSTVTDVVIDLAYNTGGNIGAVMRIFGYMTEEQFTYHSQNPADGSAVTYYIESDYVAYDYNWYVLTSGVTFSAANMFASMAKELGIPVIGQKSSGGASSIGLIILPEGSAIFISTNNVLSARTGNEIDGYEYLSVEYGIEVDYELEEVLNDEDLITVINQIKSPNI